MNKRNTERENYLNLYLIDAFLIVYEASRAKTIHDICYNKNGTTTFRVSTTVDVCFDHILDHFFSCKCLHVWLSTR